MKFKNNPAVDFSLLIITLFSIWTAVFIKDTAQEKAKKMTEQAYLRKH